MLAAPCAFVLALAMYWPSLPSGVGTGDVAEAQTVPYILGIAHPTGFPAYVLVGWAFTHAVPFVSVAWRMNVVSALSSAAVAAGIVRLGIALGATVPAALAAGLIFAYGLMVWVGALLANAQVLANVCAVFALVCAVRYAASGDRRVLFGGCVLVGFGAAAHPTAIWLTPALIVAALWQRRTLGVRAAALALLALVAPLALYTYLPLRSAVIAAQHLDPNAPPPLNGAGEVDWDTHHPRTLDGFLDEVLGREEGAGPMVARALDPRTFSAVGPFWLDLAQEQYTPCLLAIALLGAVVLAVRDIRGLSVVAAGTIGGILFAYVYRADGNIDRYVITSFAATAALAAAAVPTGIRNRRAAIGRWAITAALTVLSVTAYTTNRGTDFSDPTFDGQRIIDVARRDVPNGAVIVADWNEATALGYGAYVERVLGSRRIVSGYPAEYLRAYPQWSKTQPLALLHSANSSLGIAPSRWLQELPTSNHLYQVYLIRPPE